MSSALRTISLALLALAANAGLLAGGAIASDPSYGTNTEVGNYLKVNGINLYYEVYGEGDGESYEYGLHAWKLSFQCFDRHYEFKASPPPHFHSFCEGLEKDIL